MKALREDLRRGWRPSIARYSDSYKTLPSSLLMWMYNSTLCSCCREYKLDHLIERDELTDEMWNECMWDANLDIRDLADKKEEV